MGSLKPLTEVAVVDVTTLLNRLTEIRAGYLDNLTDLDAPVSGAKADLTTLETRLSAPRAVYLDNLANLDKAISALQDLAQSDIRSALLTDDTKFAGANIDAAISSVGGCPVAQLTFWGELPIECIVTATQTTKTLPDVAIPNLTGLNILHAYALLSYDSVWNAHASNINALSGITYVQVNKAEAGWVNALRLSAGGFRILADSTHGGGIICGGYDISSRVAFNATTNFQWTDAYAEEISLQFNHIRSGIVLTVK